jgi:hypothetical protein
MAEIRWTSMPGSFLKENVICSLRFDTLVRVSTIFAVLIQSTNWEYQVIFILTNNNAYALNRKEMSDVKIPVSSSNTHK